MKKGYQIIEPTVLNPLFSNPLYEVFSVAVMTWICSLLRLEMKEHVQHVEFEVICVTYVGSYPAIGIHYKNEEHQNIGPLVEAMIARVLRETSVVELFGFIAKDGVNWNEVTAKIMDRSD